MSINLLHITVALTFGLRTVQAVDSEPPKPILNGFTADPEARVFGDAYYIYPTVDRDEWKTTEFRVWSSRDLIHWKDEGAILDIAGGDVSWAKLYAWAPGAISRDGKYYLYFCAEKRIGVAVADDPTGPFKDALGRPLVQPGDFPELKWQQIDPFPFIDGNGDAYLFWGSGRLYVRELAPDMISFDGQLHEITPKFEGGNFREGIVVFKREDVYYFMWSENDARSPDYRVTYGTSDSPVGPIRVAEDRIVLSRKGPVIGTGHHSVINVPGTDRWYMVYHRHAIPDGSGYKRQTCIARMEFDADGTIKPVDPMSPAFGTGDVGEPIVNGRGDGHP